METGQMSINAPRYRYAVIIVQFWKAGGLTKGGGINLVV